MKLHEHSAWISPLLVLLATACGPTDGSVDPSASIAQPLCTSTLLAPAGATASSSEVSWLGHANAIDGNEQTRWASAYADPSWLRVDLGSKRYIDRVVLKWETAASADYDLQVADSSSGPWRVVYTDANGNGGTDDIRSLDAVGRYLRMYSRKRTTNWGNSLWELQTYGDPDSTCGDTPSSTPPPATPPPGNALWIDDFESSTRYGTHRNLLGGWTDDDGTLASDQVSAGALALKSNGSSAYWYSVVGVQSCFDASTYGHIRIRVRRLRGLAPHGHRAGHRVRCSAARISGEQHLLHRGLRLA